MNPVIAAYWAVVAAFTAFLIFLAFRTEKFRTDLTDQFLLASQKLNMRLGDV